mmetsp:Transcript_96577/g.249709  ORF Transcript_96577/g.249709 Transcript_96577/m.249709 type:complete len:434 (-) Transcript_96577:46-1347(-)
MLQVNVVVRQVQVGVQVGRDDGQAVRVTCVQQDEVRLAVEGHLFERIPQVLRVLHAVVAHGLVAREAEAMELVVLHEDTRRRAREVQRVRVGLAAQVRHGDGHVVAEVLALAPHDPASAADALAELVAAGGDREHVRQAEVPGRQVLLEGRDEAAGGSVHVDAHLPALLLVQLGEHLVDLPDRIVLAAVMVAHDGHHADGLLIHLRLHLLGRDREGAFGRNHELGLDVHVAEELLPSRLEAGGDHEVRVDCADLRLGEVMLLGVPLAPAELQAEAAQQARLCGAHGACTREGAVLVEVRRLGAVPQVRHHVQHDVVHLEALGVHGLIRQIDLRAAQQHVLLLGLEEDVHVGGRVEALAAIQLVVVRDHSEAVARGVAMLGELGKVLLARHRVLRGVIMAAVGVHPLDPNLQRHILGLYLLDGSLRHGGGGGSG